MGIRFPCPECGKRLNVKAFLAGKRGICPHCEARFRIPLEGGSVAEPIRDEARRVDRQGVAAGSESPGHVGTFSQAAKPAQAANSRAATAQALAATDEPELEISTIAEPTGEPASAVEDPIAAAPEAVWYVRPTTGGQYGPAKGDIMRQWLDENRVAADSLVWREGWAEWAVAGQVIPCLMSEPKPQPAAERYVTFERGEYGGERVLRHRARSPKNTLLSVTLVVILGLLIVLLVVVLVLLLRN